MRISDWSSDVCSSDLSRAGSKKSGGNVFNKKLILAAATAVVASGAAMVASADPVDDELVIDGEIPMVIRTEAPEGHPFDEVLSGWLYRTAETRALEEDRFANPAMPYVQQGQAIRNPVDGEVGQSWPPRHGDAADSQEQLGHT